MQQYFLNQGENRTLFDLLNLPETLDKDTLVENIMLQGSDFETLYSDPEFMRAAIGSWSNKWQRTFIKWAAALEIEYEPLENYDRIEDWDDTLNSGKKSSARRDSGNTRTFNNQDKRTLDTENKRTLDTDITEEQEVSAFDASTYQPSGKNTTSNDGTDTMNNTGTDTVDYSGTIKDDYGEGTSGSETENSKNTHSGRIHGNIGVTTSQQMLQSELDLQKWNIYEHITDLFLEELTIMVYE